MVSSTSRTSDASGAIHRADWFCRHLKRSRHLPRGADDVTTTASAGSKEAEIAEAVRPAHEWQADYSRALVLLDLVVLLVAALAAVLLRFRSVGQQVGNNDVSYAA